MSPPISRICRSPRFLLPVSVLSLATGLATFSLARHSTVQHCIEWMRRPSAGGLALLVVLALVIAIACLVGRAGRRRHRAERFAQALWPLLLGVPLLAWQWRWWFCQPGEIGPSVSSPWPLYLWMALLAWCAWRLGPLIRSFEISRAVMWTVVLGACALMLGVHIGMQYDLWNALSFGYHDIGLFARALHNAAEGRGLYMDSLGCVTLAEHADFLLWTLVPPCLLGLSPFFVLVAVSAGCFAAPAIIVAWYLRRALGSNLAGMLGGVAWLLLPSHGCLVLARGYGFHPVYLAVPLLVGGFAFGFQRRWIAASVCMLLACLAREEVSLTVAAWGVYVAMVEKRRPLGLAVAAVSIAYFCCMVFLVIPHQRGEPYPWIAAHYQVQPSAGGLWARLTTDGAFLATLLLPMAVLIVRPTGLLLVALPALVETTFTTNPELHSLSVHYYTPVVPVLFMAAIREWERAAAAPDVDPRTWLSLPCRPGGARMLRAGWCLFVSACLGQAYLGVGPHTNCVPRPMSSPEFARSITQIQLLRSTVPPDLSVTASYRIAAHFLDYDRLWTVNNEQLGDLVVVDDRDDWDASRPRQALARAQRLGGYQPILADYHFVALLRMSGLSPLGEELHPPDLPDGLTPASLDLGEGIRLVGRRIEIAKAAAGGAQDCKVTLLWRCEQSVPADYRFGLTIGQDRARWGPFYFARGAYSTIAWKPGELYRDDVRIAVPAGELGSLDELQVVLLE
jgi:uncharacterized membrane protein